MLFGFRSIMFGKLFKLRCSKTSNTTQMEKRRWPNQFSPSFQRHRISPFLYKEGKFYDCACL